VVVDPEDVVAVGRDLDRVDLCVREASEIEDDLVLLIARVPDVHDPSRQGVIAMFVSACVSLSLLLSLRVIQDQRVCDRRSHTPVIQDHSAQHDADAISGLAGAPCVRFRSNASRRDRRM
jgi:hypothetical protein